MSKSLQQVENYIWQTEPPTVLSSPFVNFFQFYYSSNFVENKTLSVNAFCRLCECVVHIALTKATVCLLASSSLSLVNILI